MEVFPGITMDPDIRFGKPCVTDTRVDVATVVGALAVEENMEAVQEAYQLTRAQVLDVLYYATHLAGHMPPVVRKAS